MLFFTLKCLLFNINIITGIGTELLVYYGDEYFTEMGYEISVTDDVQGNLICYFIVDK